MRLVTRVNEVRSLVTNVSGCEGLFDDRLVWELRREKVEAKTKSI